MMISNHIRYEDLWVFLVAAAVALYAPCSESRPFYRPLSDGMETVDMS